MFDRNLFSHQLTMLRKNRKLRQKDVAESIDVTAQTYSLLEKAERSPSVEVLVSIADYFAVPTDHLLGRIDKNNMKLFFQPDGELFYYLSTDQNNPPLTGSFKYSFGVYSNSDNFRLFLYLEESPGGTLIDPHILHSISHLEFLSLVSILNWKLNFKYNPYNRKNMDIIIPYKSSDDHLYQGIGIDEIRPAHLYSIDYGSFVAEYLKNTTNEKINILSNFLGTFNL